MTGEAVTGELQLAFYLEEDTDKAPTPRLFAAIKAGDEALARSILSTNPEALNMSDHRGNYPLLYAVQSANRALVRLLNQRQDCSLVKAEFSLICLCPGRDDAV